MVIFLVGIHALQGFWMVVLQLLNATPCHLSVSAWLSNTTRLVGKKRRGMNASLFVNIVKRQAAHIIEPISLQKGWVAP